MTDIGSSQVVQTVNPFTASSSSVTSDFGLVIYADFFGTSNAQLQAAIDAAAAARVTLILGPRTYGDGAGIFTVVDDFVTIQGVGPIVGFPGGTDDPGLPSTFLDLACSRIHGQLRIGKNFGIAPPGVDEVLNQFTMRYVMVTTALSAHHAIDVWKVNAFWIEHCATFFASTTQATGYSIRIRGGISVKIEKCDFGKYKRGVLVTGFTGGGVYTGVGSTTVTIEKCKAYGCEAGYEFGTDTLSSILRDCIAESGSYGFAVTGSQVDVERCHFENNTIASGYITGVGATPSVVNIRGTYFGHGATQQNVFQMPGTTNPIFVTMDGCTFNLGHATPRLVDITTGIATGTRVSMRNIYDVQGNLRVGDSTYPQIAYGADLFTVDSMRQEMLRFTHSNVPVNATTAIPNTYTEGKTTQVFYYEAREACDLIGVTTLFSNAAGAVTVSAGTYAYSVKVNGANVLSESGRNAEVKSWADHWRYRVAAGDKITFEVTTTTVTFSASPCVFTGEVLVAYGRNGVA